MTFVRPSKDYSFYGQTTSLCETCLKLVPTKIAIEGDQVFYLKRCREHGAQKTLVATDAAYFKLAKEFIKPGDLPLKHQSRTEYGCPYDCGLCPDHEQHSCLALIEVNDACNLTCPVCFAESGQARTEQKSLAEIEGMLDTLVESEGFPDLVQISGGEPTIHPDIVAILKAAKARPIRHIMLNTNGIRIARDKAFAAELAALKPGFEVYLQFDSMRREALENIRGADLRKVREQALANLEEAGISTTLVCVVKKGVNDGEVGDIVRHALSYKCVRGITFQPVQDAGRNLDFDKNRDRMLLTDIRRAVYEQAGEVFGADDVIPLPCNPDAIAIAYGLRDGAKVTPITRLIPKAELLAIAPNTISFEKYPQLRDRLFDLLSLASSGERTKTVLGDLLCCLPQVEVPDDLGYDKVFRVAIVSFLDRYNFCIAAVKRSCIHFVTPGRKIIPFDTYNLFYRNKLVDRFREAARV
ncbi:MAG: radical SAM protein [Alphaproteobacteria bacterium]|nr:radical SAM protein [Alphaproteobacteria bacterium]